MTHGNNTPNGAGFAPPNYTQTPNRFFDEVLPEIDSLSELKVTLIIMRQTFGWHKNEDELSLSRLRDLTGLAHRHVVEGVKRSMARGYVGRRKKGNSYVYGLRVASSHWEHPTSNEREHTKERVKESVEANASTGIGETPDTRNVVALEKWIVDRIYAAMERNGTPLEGGDVFKYHLGRAQHMLKKSGPTDAELESLPDAFVRLWKIKGNATAFTALNEMRRQEQREEVLAEGNHAPSYYEVKYRDQSKVDDDLKKMHEERDAIMREAMKDG